MDISDRLYVEIVPMTGPNAPHPDPVTQGGFDPALVYKVLGTYNPSETSECYFILANLDRQIWFIPQRHLRAYQLIDSDEFSLPKPLPRSESVKVSNGNGHHPNGKPGSSRVSF